MTTLARIRKKVRRLTATPSAIQLPDAEIDEYIDDFYEQDFPAHLKLFELHQKYTFYTEPTEDRYVLPVNTYLNVNPPVYIAGYLSYYTQSREEFFRIYPRPVYEENTVSGDGSAGPYTFTLTALQVLKREFYCSAIDTSGETLTVEDDGNGNLVDPGTTTIRGTINYVTGAVSVTFSNTIATTSLINCQYVPQIPSRPTACLFYQNFFFLRPVPDEAYKVDIEVFRKPSDVLNDPDDSPNLDQWWQYIAFGAAMKVLEDRGDTDAMQALAPRLDEQKQLVLHRTAVQLTPERTATIYTDQSQYPSGNFFNIGTF